VAGSHLGAPELPRNIKGAREKSRPRQPGGCCWKRPASWSIPMIPVRRTNRGIANLRRASKAYFRHVRSPAPICACTMFSACWPAPIRRGAGCPAGKGTSYRPYSLFTAGKAAFARSRRGCGGQVRNGWLARATGLPVMRCRPANWTSLHSCASVRICPRTALASQASKTRYSDPDRERRKPYAPASRKPTSGMEDGHDTDVRRVVS